MRTFMIILSLMFATASTIIACVAVYIVHSAALDNSVIQFTAIGLAVASLVGFILFIMAASLTPPARS